jgi:predicted metal-dependent hydrolase
MAVASEPTPEVEVRRSKRRRRTVSAYRDGEKVVVLVPASLSRKEEAEWVETMVARVLKSESRAPLTDAELMERALALNDRYLGGLATPASVRWVRNQKQRWGSCTPGDRAIRLSVRLEAMPLWVIDYVLVHELSHLIEPGHDAAFWGWVDRYPQSERAKGYLLGWSAASRIDPPPGQESDQEPGQESDQESDQESG